MKVITWYNNIIETKNEELIMEAKNLTENIDQFDYDDVDNIRTEAAIVAIQMKLMGEYHGILVVREEEYLMDSEIYLMSLDEIVEGGSMFRVDSSTLEEVLTAETFEG